MGGKNVKITIVEKVLSLLAPHYCYSCGKTGLVLCDNCKYDISFDPFYGCCLCASPNINGVCASHHAPFERSFIVSTRQGSIKACIDAFKFHNVKAAAAPLANLLKSRLPLIPKSAVLVPIPTSSPHIRQRGYDQTLLLAKQLATGLNTPLKQLLERSSNATQHLAASKKIRKQQAAQAFSLSESNQIIKGQLYILIDDIITTGSTVSEAAHLITNAGGRVWVAALAYQPAAEPA